MNITFCALTEHHLPLLLSWLEMPHVKAWWDQDVRWSMGLIKEKFGTYVHGYKVEHGVKKPIQAFIIGVNGKEVGYIQLYNPRDFAREDDMSFDELPHLLAAFDIFIGDPACVGKGYGSRIMKQFLVECVDQIYEACMVDPDTENVQAIRAYEKAGFERIGTAKDGAITVMIRVA